jgi:CRP-like cAMP-binding protein
VILSGRARASIGRRAVGELHPGDSFGEIALLHDVRRTATVTALEPLTVCGLEAADFMAATTTS